MPALAQGAATSSISASPLSCAELAGLTIPASVIGGGDAALATNGGAIESVQLIPAGAPLLGALPAPLELCKVIGRIMPLDSTAEPIRFQLNLPTAWNQKSMMYGGGSYNGVLANIPSGVNNLSVAGAEHPSPLARGYATYGSDSGHTAKPPYTFASRDGSFATNPEMLRNYAGDALKKTHDAAQYLIMQRYAQASQRMYFQGASNGGREALIVAQRWPEVFEGIFVMAPAWNIVEMELKFGEISRALTKPGAYMSQEKLVLARDAGIKHCDGLDGVMDGLISNVAACEASFNPQTATVNGQPDGAPLRCPGGIDSGDNTCLSDANIAVLRTMSRPFNFHYTLANGGRHYPGLHVWGGDLGVGPAGSLSRVLGMNLQAPGMTQANADMPFYSVFYDQWMKFFVAQNPALIGATVNPKHPGAYLPRISELSLLLNAKPDLRAFHARGGKMILMHGLADTVVAARGTSEYYKAVRKGLGPHATRDTLVYWQVPGYGHTMGPAFNASMDALTMLENWVENGVRPENQIIQDRMPATAGRSRPLCEFPKWPQYQSGDVNLASSFVCVEAHEGRHHEHGHEYGH
ncbi:tannase/feruloyl esterase family alpha/beta hydrolase [Massilia sp. W12]|uniref:tannase/feruloyl esterase family alpha/beta hydrolase n=1 Tax=Massilia sp. W12 TaxID=3126507 RepID=UPI0030CA7E6B